MTMATTMIRFTTPCGHEVTAKPCASRNGPNAGKWTCRIKGPKVTAKSGIKTKYCSPSQAAVQKAVAEFLGIDPLLVATSAEQGATAAVVVKKEIPKVKSPVAAAHPQSPAQDLSPKSAAQRAAAPVGHPGIIQPHQPNSHPPHVQMNPFPHGEVAPPPVMSASSSKAIIVPTAEQERIYQVAKPPLPVDNNFCVRITAGAGAGKTTTVLQLASRAARLGHKHITYLTFSRAAAADGQRRIGETCVDCPDPPVIEARTLHSCAMKLLADKKKEEFVDSDDNELEKGILDEQGLQKYIQNICQNEMDSFLTVARQEIMDRNKKDKRKAASMVDAADRQVLYYVFKTLQSFCRSPYTLEQLKNPSFRNRDYYPAKMFHDDGGDGDKNGFPLAYYKSRVAKYADMALLVWDAANRDGKRSFDLEMKRAQLDSLVIPGSLLLVDESQDMDGCQLDWILKQVQRGTHVYLVGDAAQTIYGFRGAKSKYLMDVKEPVDCTLTKSFRFGADIANVANIVLFAKETSPQTTANYSPIWWPYRVEGGGGKGTVTADPILPKWKDMPVTIIAAANATLLNVAVSMMGMTVSGDEKEETSEVASQDALPVEPGSQEPHIVTQSDTSVASSPGTPKTPDSTNPVSICIPKIHINGKGDNSGIKKWKSVFKQIKHVYDLYKSGEEGAVLPRESFREFNGEKHTWNSFCNEVENRELSKYVASMSVVCTFGDRSVEAVELFQREVTDKNYKAEEADVILTTCHSAKGMEWDNVQLCEDFLDLCNVSQDGPVTVAKRGGNSSVKRRTWQFQMKNYGDEVNLLYVACTRAKKILSVPTSIKSLLQECDMLHTMIRCRKLYKEQDGNKSSGITVFGRKEALSVENTLDLYQDVVLPLRKQCNLKTHEQLSTALIKSLEHEDCDYDEDKPMERDGELEKYFGVPEKSVRSDVASLTTSSGPPDKKQKIPTPARSDVASLNSGPPDKKQKIPTPARSDVASLNSGPPDKKQKLSKSFYALEDSKKSLKLAPKGTKRPYDKKESAPTGKAKCRDCQQLIDQGTTRIGIHVYQQDRGEWWAHWFHQKCCPNEILPQLKFDPNPPKKKGATKTKSWGGKRSWGGGGYRKGGGYCKKSYYKNGYRRR